jgi:hypothetical protein
MRPPGRIFLWQKRKIVMSGDTLNKSLGMMGICLILAYLLPYQMQPFYNFYHDWLAFFGLALAIAFLASAGGTSIQIPWITAVPLGLISLICLHLSLGRMTYAWDAVLPIAYLIGATLALILGATLSALPGGSQKLSLTLAWVNLLAGLISALIATLQITGIESLIYPFAMPMPHEFFIRPYANLAQPNQLALLFCLAIASVWILYQNAKLGAAAAIAAVLILLWGLTTTQSRIGWIIVPLFVLLTIWWRASPALKAVPVLLPCALAAGYVLLIIALPALDFGAATAEARANVPDERVHSISQRWILLQQAWQISLTHPWLGAGWGEFGPQQLTIGADFAPVAYSLHAHNIVMNFAAELGWPITLIIVAALAYWLYKNCWRPVSKRVITPETGFAVLFLGAVLVHSLTEYPLWYAYVLIPTALVMGMAHHTVSGSRTLLLPRHTLLAVFMFSAASLLFVATDYRRLVTGFRALGWENLGLKADEGSTERPDWTLFPQYYDYFQFSKSQAREYMATEDIAFTERAARRFGYTSTMLRMSFIYTLNGRPNEAVRTLQAIKNLHQDFYNKVYQNWQTMAKFDPGHYAAVFKQIPAPLPKARTKRKQISNAQPVNRKG